MEVRRIIRGLLPVGPILIELEVEVEAAAEAVECIRGRKD